MKNKIIEFVGMPGSGKTFYQKKIKNLFSNKIYLNNFKRLNKFEKFKFILISILKKPNFFFKTLLYINSLSKKKERKRYFYYFYNEVAYRFFFDAIKKKRKFLVNSEGFVYRSSNYFNYKFNDIVKQYLKSMPDLDLIFFMNCSKLECLNRTSRRQNGYKYKIEDLKSFYHKEKFLKKTLTFCKNLGIKVVFINNTQKKNFNQNIFKIIKNLK